MKYKIFGIVICMLLIASTTTLAFTPFDKNEQQTTHTSFDGISESLSTSGGWVKTFGGNKNDYSHAVQQTKDGGYIIAGTTYSFSPAMYSRFWLIKTDGDGNEMWNKSMGNKTSIAHSVQETMDGGYIIAGEFQTSLAQGYDIRLTKTDGSGNVIWNKTFGGTEWDFPWSVQQTTDGGYIIIGVTYSYGANYGNVWLIKTDSNGNRRWESIFGGNGEERGLSGQQTTDGGYIISGRTTSYGAGDSDVWLIKTDSNGNEIWNKTFGGTGYDTGRSVEQTADGGYIIGGYTNSTSTEEYDIWLIKTDSNGNKVWDKTYNRTVYDEGFSTRATTDNGYIVIGSYWNTDSQGMWLIKTDSTGNMIWDGIFEGITFFNAGKQTGHQTSDGGYILTGLTTSLYGTRMTDVVLIKTDENGFVSNPPDTPTIIGTKKGEVNTSYDYTIQTTDPDQDDVCYRIYWGDGNYTFTDFSGSGESITVSHTWATNGTYNIRIKAIDKNLAVSDWATLTVTMPCSYNKPMPHFLYMLFQRFPNAFPLLRQLMKC